MAPVSRASAGEVQLSLDQRGAQHTPVVAGNVAAGGLLKQAMDWILRRYNKVVMSEPTALRLNSCPYRIRVVANAVDGFEAQLIEIVRKHAEFDESTLDMRPSKGGKYNAHGEIYGNWRAAIKSLVRRF